MSSPAATLAWCWMIKRKDGQFFGATTHVEPIYVPTFLPGAPFVVGLPFGGYVRCQPSPGFTPTDIATTDTLAQNNLDVEAVLTAAGATEDDLRAGLWHAAALEIAIVNYRDLSMGSDTVFMGTLGGVVGGDLTFKVEQRGLSQLLEANLDGIVGPMCRVALGSQGVGKCNVNLSTYRRTGTIASPTFDRIFVDTARLEADNWWTKGLLKLTSGPMSGWIFEVKRSLANGTIELVEEGYFGLGDLPTYEITPGCNKLFKMPDLTYTGDCIVKFHNGVNFQGEPEVPGQIAISQYGGQTVQ